MKYNSKTIDIIKCPGSPCVCRDNDSNFMKIRLILLLIICIFSVNSFCQTNYPLPKGYHSFKDDLGYVQKIEGDFDNDGITDLAKVCANKKETEQIIVVFLSTRYYVSTTYFYFPLDCFEYKFEYKNNVLKIKCGNGKFYTEYKLKYYTALKDMRLIGYDEVYGGTGATDGNGYTKSINLLTNEYTVNGVRKKTNIDVIKLENIEKYFNLLSAIGSN